MANITNGYTALSPKNNLSTNGGFRINQRSNFLAYTPALQGDFLVDMWYIDDLTIDSLQAWSTGQSIKLKGRGKKGQHVVINYKDLQPLIKSGNLNGSGLGSLTTAVIGENNGGVPIRLSVQSPTNLATDNEMLTKEANLINNQRPTQALSIRESSLENIDTNGNIIATLLKDGDFQITIENHRMIAGAYRNPSEELYTNLTDDLFRCQAFYQCGIFTVREPIVQSATDGSFRRNFHLAPNMPVIPSVSIDIVYLQGGTSEDWNLSVQDITTKSFEIFGIHSLTPPPISEIVVTWCAEII